MRRLVWLGCALVVWYAVYVFRAPIERPIARTATDILLPATPRVIETPSQQNTAPKRRARRPQFRATPPAASAPYLSRNDVITARTAELIATADAPAAPPIQINLPRAEFVAVPAGVHAPLERARAPRLPATIAGLYIAYGALQGADVGTTLAALGGGGTHEVNPLLRGAVKHSAAFVAIKGASVVGTVYLVEQLRRRHLRVALVTMIAIDAAYVSVVAHNANALRSLR